MSTPAALLADTAASPRISRSDLLRLEGFGDNCELGFVLRRLGFEDGMLFRWASVKPESLLATLRGDFEALYEFDNLVPQNAKMVRDLHYGTSWHTRMHSSLRDDTLTFNDSRDQRRVMHAAELSKLEYLVGKLRAKFTHPNPVFVIKSNNGISAPVLEGIHYQIYRRATSQRFLLLEVQADPQRAGTVEHLDRNLMRGYIARLADYDSSDEGDDENWLSVLEKALACYADTGCAVTPRRNRNGPLFFSFPPAGEDDAGMSPQQDPRGGVASLIRGSSWCRLIDNDSYRLHATELGEQATLLQWAGVQLAPNSVLTVRAACAVPESVPVRATLDAIGANGNTARATHVFEGTAEQDLSLSGLPHSGEPITIRLYVEPVMPLQGNDRAVIDVASVKAVTR